jgi:predicted nucleotidyltransferase
MEISKKIKLAHTSVKQQLEKLLAEKLIIEHIDKKGTRKFPTYKANLENKEFFKYKKIFNYKKIVLSGIIEYLDNKFMPKCIILFGSYQRGEDTEDSDIDIYIQCKQEIIHLTKFEKVIDRKIELHFNEQFNKYPKELKNNISNGIVLSGFLEAYE